jgi:hypothetical protein
LTLPELPLITQVAVAEHKMAVVQVDSAVVAPAALLDKPQKLVQQTLEAVEVVVQQ